MSSVLCFSRFMKQVDTLIVGFGLAGLAYAETLYQAQNSFHVIDAQSSGSSHIAAGIYNPTVLKKFNMTWHGDYFHQYSLPFYATIAKRLSREIIHPASIFKLFSQPSDHNLWSVASDQKTLHKYLDPKIYFDPIDGVSSTFGYGKVMHCGRIDTTLLISSYKAAIRTHVTTGQLDYSKLVIAHDSVSYGDVKAKRVVFCEGYAMVSNPFFNALPLQGSKGQILLIRAPKLKLEAILKGPIFIAPLGDDLYWAGASFEPTDKSLTITTDGKEWLMTKIDKMLGIPYEIVDHRTHIRPTVTDRRPLLGTHSTFNHLHLFNGLGSRGVLTAPLAAKWLFDAIHDREPLKAEVNINRFKKKP